MTLRIIIWILIISCQNLFGTLLWLQLKGLFIILLSYIQGLFLKVSRPVNWLLTAKVLKVTYPLEKRFLIHALLCKSLFYSIFSVTLSYLSSNNILEGYKVPRISGARNGLRNSLKSLLVNILFYFSKEPLVSSCDG